MVVQAFRVRLKIKGERKKIKRERDGIKREMIIQAGTLQRDEEGERESHACNIASSNAATLPGGRSDNMYHGPPATIPIFQGGRREKMSNPERRGKREVDCVYEKLR